MSSRVLAMLIGAAAALSAASAAAVEYRGMPTGWPYSAGYAPAAAGGYAAQPVVVAYGNPSYLAGYGAAPQAAYRPTVAAAGYYQPPPTAYYAPAYGAVPAAAYYQPRAAFYAPGQSYAVSPAGGLSAGSEAAAYYGQPAALNYVPPRFNYRTAYARVPVYVYRPVTAYDPVSGQPVTCLQPQTTTTCQPQRRHWLAWLHPHNWFGGWFRGSSCGSPPPTTAYCNPVPCGTQPYYPVPTTPTIIPSVPATTQPAIPLTPYPSGTYVPPAGSRIVPPPTRIPADTQPRLPTTTIPLGPSVPSTAPGATITPLTPGTTLPSTSPPGSFGTGSSFGTGTNYPPGSDPYRSIPAVPSTTIQGSGYRSEPSGPVIRAPELNSALAPSVRAVPDPDAQQPAAPVNRAPQLLAPRDKMAAAGDRRWAVVPAVWPSKPAASTPHGHVREVKSTQPLPATVDAQRYDDSGWTSGR